MPKRKAEGIAVGGIEKTLEIEFVPDGDELMGINLRATAKTTISLPGRRLNISVMWQSPENPWPVGEIADKPDLFIGEAQTILETAEEYLSQIVAGMTEAINKLIGMAKKSKCQVTITVGGDDM